MFKIKHFLNWKTIFWNLLHHNPEVFTIYCDKKCVILKTGCVKNLEKGCDIARPILIGYCNHVTKCNEPTRTHKKILPCWKCWHQQHFTQLQSKLSNIILIIPSKKFCGRDFKCTRKLLSLTREHWGESYDIKQNLSTIEITS